MTRQTRTPLMWAGCAAIAVGMGLHLPMFIDSRAMGMPVSAMPMDDGMMIGMALVVLGCAAACRGALSTPAAIDPGLHLPLSAELYASAERGRGTGLVAGSTKIGGVGAQLLALAGLVPSIGAIALVLVVPIAAAAVMLGGGFDRANKEPPAARG